MTSIKYCDNLKCPKCGELVMFDASYTRQLPIGFGFAPSEFKFRVDCIKETGWKGDCQNGHQILAYIRRTHVTKYPKSINRKLAV